MKGWSRRQGRRRLRPGAEALEGRIALSAAVGEVPPDAPVASDVSNDSLPAEPVIDNVADTGADIALGLDPNDPAVLMSTTGMPNQPAQLTGGARARLNAARARQRFDRAENGDATPLRVVESSFLTRGKRIVGFTLKFNEPLAHETAGDARNYRVFEITKPNKWLSQLLYQDDDLKVDVVPLHSATYLPQHQSVVLLLDSPRALSRHFRIGLANPREAHPAANRISPLHPIRDVQGNTLAQPTTRRGALKRGPILIRPMDRIELEQKHPLPNDA